MLAVQLTRPVDAEFWAILTGIALAVAVAVVVLLARSRQLGKRYAPRHK